MNFSLIILIAAVTVNCLVTTINGKRAADTLAAPYIDALLPPLEDVQDNSGKDESAKINATTKATFAYETTTKAITTSTTITATTRTPINNDGNNILPEPSIEALLPPLFEAKIEKEEATKSKATTAKTTKTTTATKTTTTKRPTSATTKRLSTTAEPHYRTSTTTLKPNLKVPDLFLDPFQPPLFDNDSADVKDKKLTPTTTQKPITTKTTQILHKQLETKHFQVKTAGSQIDNKPAVQNKHVAAETQTQVKRVSFASPLENNKLPSKVKTVKPQYVAKQKTTNTKYVDKQFNYSFDLYLGSTTQRPAKSGLPTITPFPHRLGR